MSNPAPIFKNTQTRQPSVAGAKMQAVSDTKWSTKTYTGGAVAAAQTDFFTIGPSSDPTVDNYDAANQLVTSQKQFVIQALSVNVLPGAAATIADIDNFIQHGVLVLTAQQKEIGRYRLRHLSAAGGTFVAGSQVAAAALPGVINGMPQNEAWRIAELTISTNQSIKASVWMPTVAPITPTGAVNVEVDFIGYEIRPAA